MVAAQVIFRYAVQEPIVWSEEFTTLCYQWLSISAPRSQCAIARISALTSWCAASGRA